MSRLRPAIPYKSLFGGSIRMKKLISQLGICALLYSVLAISFHRDSDPTNYWYCSHCKTAKTLSSTIKPSFPLLATPTVRACDTLSVLGNHPAPNILPETSRAVACVRPPFASAQRPRPLALSDA